MGIQRKSMFLGWPYTDTFRHMRLSEKRLLPLHDLLNHHFPHQDCQNWGVNLLFSDTPRLHYSLLKWWNHVKFLFLIDHLNMCSMFSMVDLIGKNCWQELIARRCASRRHPSKCSESSLLRCNLQAKSHEEKPTPTRDKWWKMVGKWWFNHGKYGYHGGIRGKYWGYLRIYGGYIYIGGGLCLLQGRGICFCVDQRKNQKLTGTTLRLVWGTGDVMRCDQCANGDGAGGNNNVLCKKCYTGQTGLVCHAFIIFIITSQERLWTWRTWAIN